VRVRAQHECFIENHVTGEAKSQRPRLIEPGGSNRYA
jgi:hypothetical protein